MRLILKCRSETSIGQHSGAALQDETRTAARISLLQLEPKVHNSHKHNTSRGNDFTSIPYFRRAFTLSRSFIRVCNYTTISEGMMSFGI
jgi:hypothetical protein